MSRVIKSSGPREYLETLAKQVAGISPEFIYCRAEKLLKVASNRKATPSRTTIKKSYKCGCLVFTRVESNLCLLLVEQSAAPYYWGPPKGSAEASDVSALETATRELAEETGIDYYSGLPGNTSIVLSRWPQDPNEYLIYYPVFFDSPPEVSIETEELRGHKWMPVSDLLELIGQVSTPTAHLFQILSESDLIIEELQV